MLIVIAVVVSLPSATLVLRAPVCHPRVQAFAVMTAPLPDSPPEPSIGKELRIDANARGLGVAVFAAAAALVPVLAFVVATSLGMGMGSSGNGGLGTPLSLEESSELRARAGMQTSAEEEERRIARGLTAEEAREEEALVKLLRSESLRGP